MPWRSGFKKVLGWNKTNMVKRMHDLVVRSEHSAWVRCAYSYKIDFTDFLSIQEKQKNSRFWKHLLRLRDECVHLYGVQ